MYTYSSLSILLDTYTQGGRGERESGREEGRKEESERERERKREREIEREQGRENDTQRGCESALDTSSLSADRAQYKI